MSKTRIARGILITLCILIFTGCSINEDNKKSKPEETPETTQHLPGQNETNTPPADDTDADNKETDSDDSDASANNEQTTVDANELIDSANLRGDVLEFTSSGSTIIPTLIENNGTTAVAALPGYEDSANNIQVNYQEGCIFQIADIDIGTETATLSSVSSADIKKQTSVIVYGVYQDAANLNATKVIIIRYEG